MNQCVGTRYCVTTTRTADERARLSIYSSADRWAKGNEVAAKAPFSMVIINDDMHADELLGGLPNYLEAW